MTSAVASFLDDLQMAANRADMAESELQKEMSARLKALHQDRAFAYRRLNFMRTIAEAVTGAESEENAVSRAASALRARLGWTSDSEPRLAVLSGFEPVAKAVFLGLAPPEAEAPDANPNEALEAFERWYLQQHGTSFWILFEHYIPETPVVDF